MAVPRTKKTKVNRDRYNLIIQASAISLAVVIRVLKTVNDCTDKEVAEFIEGYLALYDEIGDGRVSPKECFRLQGWTDDYYEKAEQFNSNTQLYKQAGNGVTVDVIKAIGVKLKEL